MQIKVIKKDSQDSTQHKESVKLNSETESPNVTKVEKVTNVEKSAERNISKWISELRAKKELEFLNSQSFLQELKPAL